MPACLTCGEPLQGEVCPRCTAPLSAELLSAVRGASDSAPELELIRSAYGHEYEIVEELGRGGMAIVYRAREPALARDVAIKVLPLARSFDGEFVKRFQAEARMAASLDHPNIIPIYRVGQAGPLNFIVMKYIEGVSLTEILQRHGRLEPAEVAGVLLAVSGALDEAHARGIVHRDIKPANIMKDRSGRYVVMDFGIARPLGGEQLTEVGGSVGTPKYMSPEQVRAGELDGRSDFYSLGVVAYECLVGRPPFEGRDPAQLLYAHLHEPVPEPTLASAEAARVFHAIRGLLAKDPAQRLSGGAAVERALEGAALRLPSRARTTGVSWPLARDIAAHAVDWCRAHSRGASLAAVAGALVLIMAGLGDDVVARCRAELGDRPSADARAVLIDPLHSVRQGADIEISYVACGVPEGERLSVQLTMSPAGDGGIVGGVRRLFQGEAGVVRMSWEDISEGFATSRARQISPGQLEPGAHRARLRIRGSSGGEAERTMDFQIVAR